MCNSEYNGGLTREQFLFFEIRVVANLLCQGYSREEVLKKIKNENLFQFPTERMLTTITKACFRRIDALKSESLIEILAYSSVDMGKQINLYAMMRYNRIVWDFMLNVIGEKFRTQQLDFSSKDLNLFFFDLQEQNESIASWSDSTISKIKQVLKKTLIECGYLDNSKSERLNTVYLYPELESGIRENCDMVVFPAFNFFEEGY